MAAAASFLLFWLTLLAAEVEASPKDGDEPTPTTPAGPAATPTTSTTPLATPTAATTPSATPTTSLTAVASAATTTGAASGSASGQGSSGEGKVLVHKRVYDGKKDDWKPATPARSWTFEARSQAGALLAGFKDTDVAAVPAGDVTVTEVTQAGSEIYSFIKNPSGGSACPDTPTPGPAQVVLTAADFPAAGSGTIMLCAYNRSTAPATAETPKVTLTFVEAKDGVVTWRLEPETAADLYVWDESADSCTAFNGATCGAIGNGDHGNFASGQAGQYFLVTQAYVATGESCEVNHTAEYSLPGTPETRLTVTGRYVCSGAPVLGQWWLLLAFVAAVGVAWHVRRIQA